MITNRAQWLILLGVAGGVIGTLTNKVLLAHASLAVLAWIFGEWLLFRWRVELQLRHLRCVRKVNGSADESGTLWTGRRVNVSVEIIPERALRIPFIRLRDWQPENLTIDRSEQLNLPPQPLPLGMVMSTQEKIALQVTAPFRLMFQEALRMKKPLTLH